MYTCGDGSDGQLGHGVMRSTTSFKLVEWFAGSFRRPRSSSCPPLDLFNHRQDV